MRPRAPQVTNALQHLPHCLKYMRGLRDRDVFRFCAIPQIMAMGTLALCYNNGAVFEGAARRCCRPPRALCAWDRRGRTAAMRANART